MLTSTSPKITFTLFFKVTFCVINTNSYWIHVHTLMYFRAIPPYHCDYWSVDVLFFVFFPPLSETEAAFRDAAAAVSACVRAFLCTAAFWCRPGGLKLLPAPTSVSFTIINVQDATWHIHSSGFWPGSRFCSFLERLNPKGFSNALQDAPVPRRPSSASAPHTSRGLYRTRSTPCE